MGCEPRSAGHCVSAVFLCVCHLSTFSCSSADPFLSLSVSVTFSAFVSFCLTQSLPLTLSLCVSLSRSLHPCLCLMNTSFTEKLKASGCFSDSPCSCGSRKPPCSPCHPRKGKQSPLFPRCLQFFLFSLCFPLYTSCFALIDTIDPGIGFPEHT